MTEAESTLSKAQQRVVDALKQPGAYMIEPKDTPGSRTGYVTTGGIRGYICPVALSTFNYLKKNGII